MLPLELMKQIRRLQLRARRAVQTLLGGEYRSIFKGAGLSFEEVREYQPGDEVRSIDWNVTARMGTPFIKRFVEEARTYGDLTRGRKRQPKFRHAAVAKKDRCRRTRRSYRLRAIANNDRVGLIAFTDAVERFVTPAKGAKHVLRLLRDILFFEPRGQGTSLRAALDYLNQLQRKRAIVFVISDFADEGYDKAFRLAGYKHDLIAVRMVDPRENELPDAGLLQFEDAETGQSLSIDSSQSNLRDQYLQRVASRRTSLERLARSASVDLLEVGTDGNHFDALLQFFRRRERRGRHA